MFSQLESGVCLLVGKDISCVIRKNYLLSSEVFSVAFSSCVLRFRFHGVRVQVDFNPHLHTGVVFGGFGHTSTPTCGPELGLTSTPTCGQVRVNPNSNLWAGVGFRETSIPTCGPGNPIRPAERKPASTRFARWQSTKTLFQSLHACCHDVSDLLPAETCGVFGVPRNKLIWKLLAVEQS